jgi:hypothetical protein
MPTETSLRNLDRLGVAAVGGLRPCLLNVLAFPVVFPRRRDTGPLTPGQAAADRLLEWHLRAAEATASDQAHRVSRPGRSWAAGKAPGRLSEGP